MRRPLQMIAIATLIAVPTLVAVPGSAAAGTWTKITSPKGPGKPIYQFANLGTSTPTMNISGVTSNDVTAVNIYCFTEGEHQTTDSPLNAAPIPVSSGEFSATAVPTPESIGCVLRAVPSTYTDINSSGQNSGYVGAFAGPTFYLGGHVVEFSTGSKIKLWEVEDVQQRAIGIFASPDAAGIEVQEAIDDFSKIADPTVAGEFNLALISSNLVATGSPTHSDIVIDGRNAYLPNTLDGIAVSPASVPAASVSFKRLSNGNVSIAETDPLRSCSGNVYPPSSGTCTPVSTGVELKRTIVTSTQGAVATVRDKFVSTNDRAHSIRIEYLNDMPGAASGNAGVRLPGKTSFSVPNPNTTNTVPNGPRTIFLASDIHATDNQPDRADLGLTYSGKPSIYFANRNEFGLRYSRHIPAGGSANLSFALESGFGMSTVSAWATKAQKALTDHLVISSAHGSPTTIKGSITNPVNGLPATVTVRSGSKHATGKVSLSGAWTATLHLSAGNHTITATTTDPSGRTLTASTTVHVS
jgi:hypothetical protein